MKNLKNSIESILIKSNIERVEDEVSNKEHTSGGDSDDVLINSSSSFNRAHIPEEQAKEILRNTVLEEAPESKNEGNNRNNFILDRINYLIKNYDDKLMCFISEKIDSFLCDIIINASSAVSKVNMNLKITGLKELSVYFDENTLTLSPNDGGFISGNEIIYIDYSDQKVDFLILRNIESGLEDMTNQYKVILNNELVPFS